MNSGLPKIGTKGEGTDEIEERLNASLATDNVLPRVGWLLRAFGKEGGDPGPTLRRVIGVFQFHGHPLFSLHHGNTSPLFW